MAFSKAPVACDRKWERGLNSSKTRLPSAAIDAADRNLEPLGPMKLYDFKGAANPKKLRIFLAEKNIELETVTVDVMSGETRGEEFRKINPRGLLPVLELDSGEQIPESLAIMEYLEEKYPEPSLIGTTPERRLEVRSLERLCELGLLLEVMNMVQSSHPFFKSRVKQSPDVTEYARGRALATLTLLDERLADQSFVAGQKVTICDCTLYATLWFAGVMKADLDLGSYKNVERFNSEFRTRPSSRA